MGCFGFAGRFWFWVGLIALVGLWVWNPVSGGLLVWRCALSVSVGKSFCCRFDVVVCGVRFGFVVFLCCGFGSGCCLRDYAVDIAGFCGAGGVF